MKKYLSLLLVLGVLAGCSKRDNTSQPVPIPNPNPNPVVGDSNAMKYTINGITDVSLDQEEEKILVLGITHTGGKQEKLSLSVVGLPANITAVFETPNGIPSFATKLTLKSNKPVGGTYPIKIKGQTESDSVKELNLNLIVKAAPPPPPPPNPLGCIDSVIGVFTTNYYTIPIGPGPDCIVVSTGVKNQVKIGGLMGYPAEVIVTLDCTTKLISMSPQTYSGKEITLMDGGFLNGSMYLRYGVSDGISLAPYEVTLSRK